jgi:hypothetical protein
LQSQHISGCNHTVKDDFAITCIFTRLQPHQAKTNLVAIWQCHGIELFLNWFIAIALFYLFFAIVITLL